MTCVQFWKIHLRKWSDRVPQSRAETPGSAKNIHKTILKTGFHQNILCQIKKKEDIDLYVSNARPNKHFPPERKFI